jgi:hypothetical protein
VATDGPRDNSRDNKRIVRCVQIVSPSGQIPCKSPVWSI